MDNDTKDKKLNLLLSPVSPVVKLSSPRALNQQISSLSLADGVNVGLGSFDENFEAAQTADWTMCVCSITRRAFWRSRKTGNVTWSAPSGLDLQAESAPPHLLDKIFIAKKSKSRFSHIESVHSTPLDLNNPENFSAMIRVGADVYKHVDKKSQRRFICFSSNLDRIMWSQSRSTYFQGKIKGFILTSDMLEILGSDSVGARLVTNPMKTNQKECVVTIKAAHRDLDIEFDTTELADAWRNALQYVLLNMKESLGNGDKNATVMDDLGAIMEDSSFDGGRGANTHVSSMSSASKGSNLKRSSTSPTLSSDTKNSLRRGFSMKTIGSFINIKRGSASGNGSQKVGKGSTKILGKKVKGLFINNSMRNFSVTSNNSREGSSVRSDDLDDSINLINKDNILANEEDDRKQIEKTDNDDKKPVNIDLEGRIAKEREVLNLKKELQLYKKKIDVANACIENLNKSVNVLMKSQFSGDIQKDMPITPNNPTERLANAEWSKNVERFINKIANNNHLSRCVSNRSILLSGKDKDVLEQIRSMLLGHLKSSTEYITAISEADNNKFHKAADEIEYDEVVDDMSDVDISVDFKKQENHISEVSPENRNVSKEKRKIRNRKSVKYMFNSNEKYRDDRRHRAVSNLLSSSKLTE
jgi:hypothetical protein